jgi:hypothetical protein
MQLNMEEITSDPSFSISNYYQIMHKCARLIWGNFCRRIKFRRIPSILTKFVSSKWRTLCAKKLSKRSNKMSVKPRFRVMQSLIRLDLKE